MTLPDEEKLAALADPDTRARLFAASQSDEAGLFRATIADWGGDDARRDAPPIATSRSSGGPSATSPTPRAPPHSKRSSTRWSRTGSPPPIIPVPPGDDPESWAFRERTWHDPRVVLGASDAGAHVDMIWTYDWACAFLARVRERNAMPLEAAVRRISGELAELYGLVDRGHITEGSYADLVLFDADTIGPGLPEWRDDLPGERRAAHRRGHWHRSRLRERQRDRDPRSAHRRPARPRPQIRPRHPLALMVRA